MSRFRIIPYKQGSRSARALAGGLNGLQLRLEGSRFVPRRDDVIINWGNTNPPRFDLGAFQYLNMPNEITTAANKLSFFDLLTASGSADILPAWYRQWK